MSTIVKYFVAPFVNKFSFYWPIQFHYSIAKYTICEGKLENLNISRLKFSITQNFTTAIKIQKNRFSIIFHSLSLSISLFNIQVQSIIFN